MRLLYAILDGGKALRRQVFFAAAGRALLGHALNCTLPLALEIRDPVDLPGLAGVGRKSLFPVRGIGRDVRPHEAHAYRFAAQHVVGIKRADTMHETALDRGIEVAEWRAPVQPPDRPLPCVGIISA